MTTGRENYRYDASGLDGITLKNVTVHRCPDCGEYEVAIPAIEKLHAALAQAVASKPERLTPRDIRFLRTYLGYSSADFARRLGVSPSTVSRWEREDEPLRMKPTVERLVRVMALAGDAVKSYQLEEMGTEAPSSHPLRLEVTREGGWRPAVIGRRRSTGCIPVRRGTPASARRTRRALQDAS
jgi:putative zinc finger/helix-turn-helix YgiT family protein